MQTTTETMTAPFEVKADSRASDKRRDRRYAIPRGMKLKVQASPLDDPLDAELRDISRNGVGLLSPKRMAPGASISFPFGSQRVFANVRYCRPSGSLFSIGALIREVVSENGAIGATLNV